VTFGPETLAIRKEMLEALVRAAARHVRGSIDSATLRQALRAEVVNAQTARLLIPHYWALYQHDGRGVGFPRRSVFLVYFVDPNDDPRLEGGYPVRLNDVRRLTKDEFRDGQQRNREMEADNPEGGPQQFMRVLPQVGPTAPDKSYPFFTKGMAGFQERASFVVRGILDRLARRIAVSRKSTARIKL
jgi:hypothetical protein